LLKELVDLNELSNLIVSGDWSVEEHVPLLDVDVALPVLLQTVLQHLGSLPLLLLDRHFTGAAYGNDLLVQDNVNSSVGSLALYFSRELKLEGECLVESAGHDDCQ